MSSRYRVLCLSHDPALTTDHEFTSAGEAEAAIAAGIPEHASCDLLIGRYSYPLIEVGCPASHGGQSGCYHVRTTNWVDVGWLKLLYLAQKAGLLAEPGSPEFLATEEVRRCWRPERVERLREELGLSS